MFNTLKKLVMLLGDIIVIYLSLYLVLSLRYLKFPSSESWSNHVEAFLPVFAMWFIILYISNLYDLRLAGNIKRLHANAVRSFAVASLLALAYFYIAPASNINPKTILVLFMVIYLVIFLIWRRVFGYALQSYLPRNTIAFVGITKEVRELISAIHDNPQFGYSVAFIIAENSGSPSYRSIPIFEVMDGMRSLIRKHRVNTVVIAKEPEDKERLRKVLFSCLSLKLDFLNLPNFYESVTGKVPLLAINKMWFLENLNEANKRFFDRIKRYLDLICAFIALIICLPIWLIIAIVIHFDSPGPIFFHQIRLGRGRKEFDMIKFRSMRIANNDFAPTATNDPRVTKFGNFLRRTRLDETPQIINIIKGDMSFIGPRPEQPRLVTDLEKNIPFYNERMLVKPGVTGWDQVSGKYHSPSLEDTLEKLQHDLYYIKNRSIFLDMSIAMKTIATVLSKSGV